ncbi:zinc finger, CCHC-type containing protein [Tanacetum coccineum]
MWTFVALHGAFGLIGFMLRQFKLGRSVQFGGAISWASKKQTCITGSTIKSEFVALAAAGKEAEWLRNLILEIPLWFKPIAPISIRCDSDATLAKSYSQMYNGKSRHLGARHSVIRELITNEVIYIEFVRSQQNLADHLTKGLARDVVIKSTEWMGLKGLKYMYVHIILRMCLERAENEDEIIHGNAFGDDDAMKHMPSNFAKLDKFEGVDFRRWHNKMHFLLSSMSVVYVMTTPIPEKGDDDATVEQIRKRAKWDNDDYDSFEAKYMVEDVSSKKFLVSKFTNYKMIDSRPVLEKYNELLGILRRFTQHKMNMDESIQVSCIIDKLPLSWKDFKHTLKHLKEELTPIELGSHLRIEESLKVQDNDKPKGNNGASPYNQMFRLNIVNDNIASTYMSTSKLNDSILWHARLSHVYFNRMQDTSKDGLILAFDMDTKKCKTYMLNKISKKPFQNVKRKTEVLELIHNDLCDMHATPSLGNKKYFVTFIDDASRKNRVLKEMVNSMLSYLGLSQGFWGEAILIARYLLNEIPNKRNMITPYELWTKRKPNLNYLRVWGCRVVIRLPDPKLKTLGERGIECIFVGYTEHSKALRFYIIEPNDSISINLIIESSDAIFDENRFSSVPRPS